MQNATFDVSAKSIDSWPEPPLCDTDALPISKVSPVACIVVKDNEAVIGNIYDFNITKQTIDIVDKKGQALRISFNDFRELHLTKPVVILQTSKAGAPSVRPLRLQHTNNEERFEEIKGFIEVPQGLFYNVKIKEDSVRRTFVPKWTIKKYTVGDLIGVVTEREGLVSQEIIESAVQMQTKKIGDILQDSELVTPAQLEQALRAQTEVKMKLGNFLVKEGIITTKQLESALAQQKINRNKALGEILVDMQAITPDQLKKMLATKAGIPFVDIKKFQIDKQIGGLIPEKMAWMYRMVPLCKTSSAIVVAMEDPLDWSVQQQIRAVMPNNIRLNAVMTTRHDIDFGISLVYSAKLAVPSSLSVDELGALATSDFEFNEEKESSEPEIKESDNKLVRLVNGILASADKEGASDIHIEPRGPKKTIKIRFRIDGVLKDFTEVPAPFRAAMVSRLKIMASMDISDRRRPQDGQITFGSTTVRVATIPTSLGENVVLRLLRQGAPSPIGELGMDVDLRNKVQWISERPHGLMIVCGPTGSGKSTTLHSVLSYLNTSERKIWTAEDPIEVQQDGLNQVAVNVKGGVTFATALRSFLRADPDVIMVGEARDEETATIAVQAALTGHMVFTTLHTNSAAETARRLLDMGLDPYNLADALRGVLAQRLVRKLCSSCKRVKQLSSEELKDYATEYCFGTPRHVPDVLKHWETLKLGSIGEAVGCQQCGGSGFKGRLALHELLEITEEVRELIQSRAKASEILKTAVNNGMITLKQVGIHRALKGLTTIHEVRAACS